MRELSLDESRKIMIDMLEEIDEYCRNNNIQYFLTGGTLLGAIRHNGFIPWDDDIDIALKRNDYEKLINDFKSSSGNVEILCYKNKKNYIWPAAKVVNNKTVLIENGIEKAKIGIFLDMFPLDYINGDYEFAKSFVRKVLMWKNILTLKYLKISNRRPLYKNIIIIVSKLFYLIPDKLIIKKIDSLSQTYAGQHESKYLCNFSGAWGVREIVKSEAFDKSIDHVFENRIFKIPYEYDYILQKIYGNYMELPPEEKRASTHSFKVYCK